MQVHKFGGASLASPSRLMQTKKIMMSLASEDTVLVVSAMGKTTNALEELLAASRHASVEFQVKLQDLRTHHLSYLADLKEKSSQEAAQDEIEALLSALEEDLRRTELNRDAHYDLIIGYGEKLSSTIVYHHLKESGRRCQLLSAEDLIITDEIHRNAKVDWTLTESKIKKSFAQAFQTSKLIITQGFIGKSRSGTRTSLGREGSDYTASILSYCLDAECMTVWKDVLGIYNSDPNQNPEALLLPQMDYREVIEMGYYGAKIIHHRTIKPLQNKAITLKIKSFIDPDAPGSVIDRFPDTHYPPLSVQSDNQVMCRIKSRDLSYIAEDHMAEIFSLLNRFRLKVNLMRNTALSFFLCFRHTGERTILFLDELSRKYEIEVEEGLDLLTIRHAGLRDAVAQMKGKEIIYREEFEETQQLICRKI